jgi:NAD(P)-dependent dehydrogenase (short-subunit alcohol dehydrogenase family)
MNWPNTLDMTGRRVLITGAAGALGRQLATGFAQFKADLVLVDRPDADWPGLRSAISAVDGLQAQTIHCDLENQTERQSLIESVSNSEQPLSVLVNNAAFVGTSSLQGWAVPFDQQTMEAWRRALEVNLTAAFHLCQGFQKTLARSGCGNVVNIGSIYGALGPDWGLYEGTAMSNPAAYAASKGGLIQLTRWLATTMAPSVRVNAVSPGGIARGQPQSFVRRYEARTPLGRMGTEADMVGAILFLASDWAAYMTGQHLMVDGGWSAW